MGTSLFTDWRLSKTKSIGSGSDSESQAGRYSDGYGAHGWCLDLRRGGRWGEGNESGYDLLCFKFEVKECEQLTEMGGLRGLKCVVGE